MNGLKPDDVINARQIKKSIKEIPLLKNATLVDGRCPRYFSCHDSIPFPKAKNEKKTASNRITQN